MSAPSPKKRKKRKPTKEGNFRAQVEILALLQGISEEEAAETIRAAGRNRRRQLK